MGGAPYKSVKEKDGGSFGCFRMYIGKKKRRPPMSSLQLLDAFEGDKQYYVQRNYQRLQRQSLTMHTTLAVSPLGQCRRIGLSDPLAI